MNTSPAKPQQRPPVFRLVGWGAVGGIVGIVLLFVGLQEYPWEGRPGEGGGLGAAFFAYGLFWLFVTWCLPVFAAGAIIGALAARRSSKCAVLSLGGVAVLLLLSGWVAFGAIERSHERAERLMHSGLPPPVIIDAAEFVTLLNGDSCALILARHGPQGEEIVSRACGMDGVVFEAGGEPVPAATTIALSWPQPDRFEVTIDYRGAPSGGVSVNVHDIPNLEASLNGSEVNLPLIIPSDAGPQTLVIRGQVKGI